MLKLITRLGDDRVFTETESLDVTTEIAGA